MVARGCKPAASTWAGLRWGRRTRTSRRRGGRRRAWPPAPEAAPRLPAPPPKAPGLRSVTTTYIHWICHISALRSALGEIYMHPCWGCESSCLQPQGHLSVRPVARPAMTGRWRRPRGSRPPQLPATAAAVSQSCARCHVTSIPWRHAASKGQTRPPKCILHVPWAALLWQCAAAKRPPAATRRPAGPQAPPGPARPPAEAPRPPQLELRPLPPPRLHAHRGSVPWDALRHRCMQTSACIMCIAAAVSTADNRQESATLLQSQVTCSAIRELRLRPCTKDAVRQPWSHDPRALATLQLCQPCAAGGFTCRQRSCRDCRHTRLATCHGGSIAVDMLVICT